MSQSSKSITSSELVDDLETIETISNRIRTLNDSIASESNDCISNITSSNNTAKQDLDLEETTNESVNVTNKSADITIIKPISEQHKKIQSHSSSKLSKLNRSISSSILSINKFKRKKACRQSMNNDQDFETNSILLPVNNAAAVAGSYTTRKSLTSKNLLKQIENLHEQAGKLWTLLIFFSNQKYPKIYKHVCLRYYSNLFI